ncbi:MAG: FmdB family zinc ribbon protein [Anaerolineae bacterium]
MPVYAYECEACHYEFERRQSFADGPIKVCPNCGEPSARRLITPVGVIFRGPGFYVTDNRKALSDGKSSDTSTSPASKTEKSEKTAV